MAHFVRLRFTRVNIYVHVRNYDDGVRPCCAENRRCAYYGAMRGFRAHRSLIGALQHMQRHQIWRSLSVLALIAAFVTSQVTWALAGTTGGVSGTVTDDTGAPI